MPGITKLLGIGDAITPAQTPRWLRYPYLRLGHLVETAVLCKEYGIAAVKLPFGGAQLLNSTFGVESSDTFADDVASYVVAWQFNSDLGALLLQNTAVFHDILRFGQSAEGEALRRDVGAALRANHGHEFNASINAGLQRNIPPHVLQKARDRLLSLVTERSRLTPVPAVW